jgi:hypothetical protein
VIADPPLEGAVHSTSALASPALAPAAGEPGTFARSKDTADEPGSEVPTELLAAKVNVYRTQLSKLENDADNVEPLVVMTSPAEDVTVYLLRVLATALEPSAIAVTMG